MVCAMLSILFCSFQFLSAPLISTLISFFHLVQDKDFFKELEGVMRESLTEEQTQKFMTSLKGEYRKMVAGWNLEDIETVATLLGEKRKA